MALGRINLAARFTLVAAVVACALLTTGQQESPSATPRLWAAAGPTLSISNSKDGQAFLNVADLRPAGTATGTVTVGNTGTIPGDFTLSISELSDTPGPGGGSLSGALDLLVEDVTGSPVPVYAGNLAAMAPRALGAFAPGESRTYQFTVALPDGGAADNALMGSALTVGYRWTATGEEPGGAGSGVEPLLVPDKKAPQFQLGGKKRQYLLPRARRRAGLVVVVRCDEAATVRVKVALPAKRAARAQRGRKSTLTFRRATKRLTAGKRTKLRLTLTRRSARLARRVLRGKAGKQGIKSTVVATATDTSGNTTTKRMRVVLFR